MKSFYRYLIGVVSSLLLVSCGGGDREPDAKISNSFKPMTAKEGSGQVGISKSALGKDFLFQGSLIVQNGVPMFNGLKSRIVYFKHSGKHLAMFESSKNQTIANDLETKFLLATFPVIEETADEVIFDFASGMGHLFVASDWYASDFQGADYLPNFSAVSASASFVESVRFSNKNELVIHHIAQIPMPGVEGTDLVSVQAHYYLSPYAVNEGFRPTESKSFERMGFFEVTPQIVDGKNKVYASKFDHRKPIVYGISANTPSDYRQAVKDGILYWNKAFGREILSVIDADADVTAPHANVNLIQWVNWDDAGFAYADAQMDPLTGEIRHSQVFMTSAFAFHGKSRARQLLAGFEQKKKMAKEFKYPTDGIQSLNEFKKLRRQSSTKRMIGLRGLTQNHLCHRDETQNIERALLALAEVGATEEQALKLAQDYVREVVAHEVGHTLGLRHNFAGSLSANFSLAERDDLFKRYAHSGSVDLEIRTSSSVMEYQLFKEAAMSGDFVAKGPEALTYDEKAIRALYEGVSYPHSELPLFCTDSLESQRNDCKVFDSGYSPLGHGLTNLSGAIEQLARTIVEVLVAIRTDPEAIAEGFDFEDIGADAVGLAMYLNDARMEILPTFFYDLLPYLKIERSFEKITAANYSEFMAKSKDYVNVQIDLNGGMTGAFPNFDPQAAQKLSKRVMEIVQNEEMLAAYNGGRAFQFSEEDLEKISLLLNLWTTGMNAFGVEDELFFVAAMIDIKNQAGSAFDRFNELVGYKLSAYLLGANGLAFDGELKFKKPNGSSRKAKMKLPAFTYDAEARVAALRAYQLMASSSMDGAAQAVASAKQALTAKVKEAMGGYMPSDVDPASVDGVARQWIVGVSNLLAAF